VQHLGIKRDGPAHVSVRGVVGGSTPPCNANLAPQQEHHPISDAALCHCRPGVSEFAAVEQDALLSNGDLRLPGQVAGQAGYAVLLLDGVGG
jgi:hypothetical protein